MINTFAISERERERERERVNRAFRHINFNFYPPLLPNFSSKYKFINFFKASI